MIANSELIEYAKYVENYYGTPRDYVERQLESGKDVILEIEIQGALKVKKGFPGYVAFIHHSADSTRAEKPSGRKGNRDAGCDRVKNGSCL